MDKFCASAPGNIFFFGEHAAVYGRPAICAAVERRTYVELKKRSDSKILVDSDSFGKGNAELSASKLTDAKFNAPELATTFEFLGMLIAEFKIKSGFELKIASNVPVNSGMSSSTALLSAVFSAFCSFAEKKIMPEKYFDYLYPMQVKIHGGKASGAEIISSALGGFNKIKKVEKNGKTELEWKHLGEHNFSIVIGDTKISSPTAKTVGGHIPKLIAENKNMVFGIFDEIAAISKKAEQALAKGDEITLGKLMNKNQELLSSLGLSHPKLDECINVARKAGALGAKLSGKGWGGIMFALTAPKDADKVLNAIKLTGADAFKTKVGGAGVL